MADLSQTAANVKPMSAGTIAPAVGGEALTQGQPLYQSGSKWYRCEANDGAEKANCQAIALTSCAIDGVVIIARDGVDVDLGATLTVGETYVLSANVGAIAPIGDLASTHFVTTLGVATSENTLRFRPQPSGVQKP